MRYLASLVVFVVGLASMLQAAENPFKTAKVGDYTEYKMSVSSNGQNIDGKLKVIIINQTDKEATLKSIGSFMGVESPPQETKIDTTIPFDPINANGLPNNPNAKISIVADGKEEIKVGDKKYACTWTKVKVVTKENDQETTAELKLWLCKEVPLYGIAKLELTSQTFNLTMEFAGNGHEIDHPFRKAKVGDNVDYQFTMTFNGNAVQGRMKSTVSDKTDKEATVKVVTTIMGTDSPPQDTKIDLTKPFDPINANGLPPNPNAKISIIADGKEEIKVGDKKYACTWTKLKSTTKEGGKETVAEMKLWVCKDIPLYGIAKLELTGPNVTLTMEYVGFGGGK